VDHDTAFGHLDCGTVSVSDGLDPMEDEADCSVSCHGRHGVDQSLCFDHVVQQIWLCVLRERRHVRKNRHNFDAT
jgi:hypothetical protein